MIRTLAIIAAFALAAGSASAQKLDAKGQCPDAHGKSAPASACKAPAAQTAANAATVQKTLNAPAPHHCITGKACGKMCIPDYWTCKEK